MKLYKTNNEKPEHQSLHDEENTKHVALNKKSLSHEVTLGIFPFENLTEGNGLEVFCKSFYIDLVTELSRFRQFRIIAFESLHESDSLTRTKHVEKVNPEYVIKGSFRYHNGQVRINAQLIKSEFNQVTWADRYEGDKESILSIQEDLLTQIVSSLQQQLNYDLLSQIRRKSPVNLSVYENWLYGMEELKQGTLEADIKAREYFQRAMEIDPNYSLAYSGMSLTYFNEWSCQLWDRWDVCQKGAFEWARKAIELDENNYVAALVLGRVYLYESEYELSEHYLRKALRLNPNDIDNLIQIASCFVFLGYPKEAQSLYQKVLQLNPLHSDNYNPTGAFIAFELGQFEKSVALGLNSRVPWVDFQAYMAAAYFHLGDLDHMNRCWQIFLQQFERKILKGNLTDADLAVQWMANVNPYKDKTNLNAFWKYISSKEVKPTASDKVLKADPHEAGNFFCKSNAFWEISFEGKSVQLMEVKGFYDLVKLLENPEKQFHCTELIGSAVLAGKELVFDEKAKKSYHKRILELQEEIKYSEENNDLARTASLQKEYEDILEHLTKSLGMGGKTRKAHDPIEKARSAVTWRIRNAIQKIEKANPALAKHLSVSVKTGLFCQYSPEKPVKWRFTIS